MLFLIYESQSPKPLTTFAIFVKVNLPGVIMAITPGMLRNTANYIIGLQ